MLTTDLHDHLTAELDLMQHFLFALEKENTLLLSNYHHDDLYDLTELKNSYAEQLAQAANLRDSALNALQLPAGKDGLLLAAQLHNEELGALVQQLMTLAQQGRQLNDQNGLLINTYLDYNQQALQALGQANPTAASVYDAHGKKQPHLKKRGIGQV